MNLVDSSAALANAIKDAEGREDWIVPTNGISVSPSPDGGFPLVNIPGRSEALPLGEQGNAQLATAAGIPSAFSVECSTRYPEAWANTLGAYIKDVPTPDSPRGRSMVRVTGGVVNGVVSASYCRMDTVDVLRALESAGLPDFQADYKNGKLRVAMKHGMDFDPFGGNDVLKLGVMIKADDWGLGALSAEVLLYRQWCSNGAVVKLATLSDVSRQHRGPRRADFGLLPAVDDNELVTLDEWLGGANSMVSLISSGQGVEQVTNMIQRAASTKARDEVAAWKIISKAAGMSDSEIAAGWANAKSDTRAPGTAWAFGNAVTSVANKRRGQGASLLETLGGNIFALDGSWGYAASATVGSAERAKLIEVWEN